MDLDWIVPLAILWRAPAFLAAPWWILVRLDVGFVLLVFACSAWRPVWSDSSGWARLRRGQGLPKGAATAS